MVTTVAPQAARSTRWREIGKVPSRLGPERDRPGPHLVVRDIHQLESKRALFDARAATSARVASMRATRMSTASRGHVLAVSLEWLGHNQSPPLGARR